MSLKSFFKISIDSQIDLILSTSISLGADMLWKTSSTIICDSTLQIKFKVNIAIRKFIKKETKSPNQFYLFICCMKNTNVCTSSFLKMKLTL